MYLSSLPMCFITFLNDQTMNYGINSETFFFFSWKSVIKGTYFFLICLGSVILGCHLYSINTHHGVELRIVAAIRNKLLLITRKHPRLDCLSCVSTSIGTSDSPVEEFQYIRVGENENVY